MTDSRTPPKASGIVLIADDYGDTRELFSDCLSAAGFTTIEARDGVEAVAVATSQRVDAIVMDLQMLNMDGWEATRRIRAAVGKAPYIVAVSGHFVDESRRDAYDAGVDDFVGKPLAPDVLVQIVGAALRSRRLDSDG